MKKEENKALRRWKSHVRDMLSDTPVDNRTPKEIEKHRLYLEAHPLEWIKFFFPKYAKYEFAPFQERAIMRCIKHDEWYEVLSWARSLAKSTVVMFIVLFLTLTGKKHNVIMGAATEKAAIRLLNPYRKELERNGRLKAYYGKQMNPGSWKAEEFITKKGVSFMAVGPDSAPRGSRNEEKRPDVLLLDDFDTDEACRNPDQVDKKWQWWEQALYGTRDPAVPLLVIICGNIIAKDCCVTRAGVIADNWDIINIRDKNGVSSWPQKNTEEAIDNTLSKISTKAQQSEYYNNPISEGEVFKEIHWGKIPPLSRFKFLVNYGDPAPGENKTKNSSTKGVCLLGELDGIYYVIKCFLDRGLNADFIGWYFLLNEYVGGKATVYNYMENNSLQDPFFRQVFKPLLAEKSKEKNTPLSILPDEQKKTEKGTRIEANLEPINREGRLVFNEKEKGNPHMMRMVEQFIMFTLRLKFPADGPDIVEGGKRIIDNKKREMNPPVVIPAKVFRSKNRYRR